MEKLSQNPQPFLAPKPGSGSLVQGTGGGEDAWIEVISKMDEVYSDLVRSQDELEQQNVRLEEAQLLWRLGRERR